MYSNLLLACLMRVQARRKRVRRNLFPSLVILARNSLNRSFGTGQDDVRRFESKGVHCSIEV